MNNKRLPLIKEYRIDKLTKCIECIDKHCFNRNKQKDCVLQLYPNKKAKSVDHLDKSIFRGMVIPSLRYLGLIVGYDKFIRASANGKLIIESQVINSELHQRVFRAVIFEVDKKIFNFIGFIGSKPTLTLEEIINYFHDNTGDISYKQKKERIKKWLSILKQVELINTPSKSILINDEDKIYLNKKTLRQTVEDTNANFKNSDIFKKYFLNSYLGLSNKSAGVVDIIDLREVVSIKMLREEKMILTEAQFDGMLRETPFETETYLISFGKPMGAQEKLFQYKGSYFKTVFIKIRKKVTPDDGL
jgi:hypothetical protein